MYLFTKFIFIIQFILFVYTNDDSVENKEIEKTEFICSRNHPTVGLPSKNGKHSLLTILEEINIVKVKADFIVKQSEKNKFSLKAEVRRKLMNKLFFSLPQWRRKKVALLYCKNVLGKQNLENCFNLLLLNNEGLNARLLELLIIDRSEALAERLYATLSENNTDFDILYDIILASPKFELQKIISQYPKFYNKNKLERSKDEEFKNFVSTFEKNKKSNISKLEEHLYFKKHLEKDKRKNDEIWELLIGKIDSVNKGLFSDDEEIEEIFKQIIEFCNDSKNASKKLDVKSNIHVILRNFVYKSKYIKEVGNMFLEKCVESSGPQTLADFLHKITLPEYMIKMLIITGLVGEQKYEEDLTNRLRQYIEYKKTKELLSLVVIHHGKDLFKIIKSLKNKIKIDDDILGFYFENIVENCGEETEKEYKLDLELDALEYEYNTRVEKMNKLIRSEKFKNIADDVSNNECSMEKVLKFSTDFLHENVFLGYKNEKKYFEKIFDKFKNDAKYLKELKNLKEEERANCLIFAIKKEKDKFYKKLENFKQKFEQKYLQNEIENREDFETVGEWKEEKEKLIDKLELPTSDELFEIQDAPNSMTYGSNHPSFSRSSTFSIGESSTSKGWPLSDKEMARMSEHFPHDDFMEVGSERDTLSNAESEQMNANNYEEDELFGFFDLNFPVQNYLPPQVEQDVINIEENTSPPPLYSPYSSSDEKEKKKNKHSNSTSKKSLFKTKSTVSSKQKLKKKANLKRRKTV